MHTKKIFKWKRKLSFLLVLTLSSACLGGCRDSSEPVISSLPEVFLTEGTVQPSMDSEASEYIKEIQDGITSLIHVLYDGETYSYADCAAYCETLIDSFEDCRAKVSSMDRGENGEETLGRFSACMDEILSLTDFIRVSNSFMEEYVSGTSDSSGSAGMDYYNSAYNTWLTALEDFSSLEAPAAVGDIWTHFTDSMPYYYEALEAYAKAYPSGELEDTLAAYTGESLLARYQVIFRNYYQMMTDQETFALQHQSYILDCLLNGFPKDSSADINVSYEMTDDIMPNLYPGMDSALNLSVSTDLGTREVLISAEIEGFTQTYQQKITVTPEETIYMIKPQAATELMDLNTSKTTQFNFSLTDADTGKILLQDTQPVTIESIYDISYISNEFGTTDCNNILAWITAESNGILALRRNAAEILGQIFGEAYNSLPGYQTSFGLSAGDSNITAFQIYALQCAISKMGVRYNNGGYSFSETQRVLMPDAVLSSGSGICIETSILMASALLSAGMHPLIILTPGHAQVAVETWRGSGEYFLVETTALPFSAGENINNLVTYMTAEEWAAYLASGAGSGITYVLDCSLQKDLGIKGLDYYTESI